MKGIPRIVVAFADGSTDPEASELEPTILAELSKALTIPPLA
nr:hypothetical protein [Clostridioides difficile]